MKNNEANYIRIINNFWNIAPHAEGYNSDIGILFFSIIDSINKNDWEDVEVEYDRMINKCRLNKRNYLESRKWLKENNFISLTEGRGDYQKAKFGLFSAVTICTALNTATDTANDTAFNTSQSTATITATDTHIINKPLNLETTKPLNKEESEFSKNENPTPSQSEIDLMIEVENLRTENLLLKSTPKKTKKEKAPQAGGAGNIKIWGEWMDGEGDGELQSLLIDYYSNPNSPKYETTEYRKFKAYWTAIVLVGTGKGKELWRTKQTFSIAGRLSTWNGKIKTFNQNKDHGTTSQISNPRSKNNWNAEEVARDAIAIATAHLR